MGPFLVVSLVTRKARSLRNLLKVCLLVLLWGLAQP